jgi:hypothetical protein
MRCIARPTVRSLLAILILGAAAPAARAETPSFTADHAAVYVQLALDCTEREYPNQIQHVMQSDADRGTPRELTPAFYGCYDWHSSVHGHWLLARLARWFPDAPFAPPARAALHQSLTAGNISAEVAYMNGRRTCRLRAAVRPCMVVAARGRAAGVGRPAGKGVVGNTASARATGCGEACRMAAEAVAAYSSRRARSDRVCIRSRARLGKNGGRPPYGATAGRTHTRLLPRRPRVPDGIRAFRTRFSLALPGRGRPDATRARPVALRRMAAGVPAAAPSGRGLFWLEPAVVTDPGDPSWRTWTA